jgi:hypothetical protein
MATICGAFNNHVREFFDDIKRVAPDDRDIIAAETAVNAARRANATLFLKAWKKYTTPYQEQIENKDLTFFLSKDYSSDVDTEERKGALLDAIERIRRKVATMEETHQIAIMGYVHNLTKLAGLYIAN